MPFLQKIRRSTSNPSNAYVTLPAQWVEWARGEGYDLNKVDVEITGDGALVLRPVRPAGVSDDASSA